MKRKWIEPSGEVGIEDISVKMIRRTQAYASRIGFPCIDVIAAVCSYTDPDTDRNYTKERAQEVVIALGMNIEEEMRQIERERAEYEAWVNTQPVAKDCLLCGHIEIWHHWHGTNKCQFVGCNCDELKVE